MTTAVPTPASAPRSAPSLRASAAPMPVRLTQAAAPMPRANQTSWGRSAFIRRAAPRARAYEEVALAQHPAQSVQRYGHYGHATFGGDLEGAQAERPQARGPGEG